MSNLDNGGYAFPTPNADFQTLHQVRLKNISEFSQE